MSNSIRDWTELSLLNEHDTTAEFSELSLLEIISHFFDLQMEDTEHNDMRNCTNWL